jgi:hypothetical protein
LACLSARHLRRPKSTSRSHWHEQAAEEVSDSLLEVLAHQEANGQPQRLFTAFWYRADLASQRWVVVKCEANAQGTNRRAVVTNRPGAFVLPGAAYDAYAWH